MIVNEAGRYIELPIVFYPSCLLRSLDSFQLNCVLLTFEKERRNRSSPWTPAIFIQVVMVYSSNKLFTFHPWLMMTSLVWSLNGRTAGQCMQQRKENEILFVKFKYAIDLIFCSIITKCSMHRLVGVVDNNIHHIQGWYHLWWWDRRPWWDVSDEFIIVKYWLRFLL